MKLIVSIVQSADAPDLVDALTTHGYRVTRISTAGGFLKERNETILIGVADDELENVFAIIRTNCQTRMALLNTLPPVLEPGEFYWPEPVEVQIGGATVFVLDVVTVVPL